ncbi:MAG: WD40/YVTN/BNR-like repeat-containing protein [Terracidiphilus sp.]
MQVIRFALLVAASAIAAAQSSVPVQMPTSPAPARPVSQVWQMQDSDTTAGLRGIDSVDGKIAWASGTGGTVLKTTDGGAHWQKCAVPDAEKDGTTLDFRGVQAWDENNAIVMASGPGDKSRLYKTTDGCGTWKLAFTNPDSPVGFWDAVEASVTEAGSGDVCTAGSRVITGTILGDPAVHKASQWDTTTLQSFYLANFEIGITCSKDELSPSESSIFAGPAEAAFAASNSALARLGPGTYWMALNTHLTQLNKGFTVPSHYAYWDYCDINVPFSRHSVSAGVFSLAIRPGSVGPLKATKFGGFHWKAPSCQKADMVVVGGDYSAINDNRETSAFTGGTNKFKAAQTPPHGYRSSVQWSESLKLWITVGTNGSDLSRDDGKTWQPLDDGNWNALSLPFVVGPNGRIARLNPSALPQGK